VFDTKYDKNMIRLTEVYHIILLTQV